MKDARALILLLAGLAAWPAEVRAEPPSALFQGYDSVVGDKRDPAVTGEVISVGAESSVDYNVCTDASAVRKSLEIDASAAMDNGAAGISAKVRFFNSLEITTNSLSIVVHAKHVLARDTTQNIHFVQGINLHAGVFSSNKSHVTGFVHSYGDSFVSSLVRGGEYIGVYTFYARNSQERTELLTSMSAHGIIGGAAAQASLQTNLSTFLQSTHTQTVFRQTITGFDNPPMASSEGLIAFALRFPQVPMDHPAIISFEVEGYEHVSGVNAANFSKIVINREYFLGLDTTGGLSSKLQALDALESQIHRVLGIERTYGGYADPKLTAASSDVAVDKAQAVSQIRQFEVSPMATFTMPPFNSLTRGSPSIAYSIETGPAFGSAGGAPFDDVDRSKALDEQLRIASIQMLASDKIDALIVNYASLTGSVEVKRGGESGHISSKLDLLPTQYISRIQGFADSNRFVNQLTFTNGANGGILSWGSPHGQAFDWAPPPNAVLIGFSGFSGGFLGQLRPVFIHMLPATWQRPLS